MKNPIGWVLYFCVVVLVLSSISCQKSGNTFSGYGKFWIAYDNQTQAHLIKDDGTDDTVLTTSDSTLYQHTYPVWSPDKKSLFMYREKIGSETFEVSVLNIATRKFTVFYTFPQYSWYSQTASWSDGLGNRAAT